MDAQIADLSPKYDWVVVPPEVSDSSAMLWGSVPRHDVGIFVVGRSNGLETFAHEGNIILLNDYYADIDQISSWLGPSHKYPNDRILVIHAENSIENATIDSIVKYAWSEIHLWNMYQSVIDTTDGELTVLLQRALDKETIQDMIENRY
jgi:hypothetical protein